MPLHVAQRFERAIAGAGDGATVATVVEQGVDRFLEHALLVTDDDVGRLQLQQVLQAVVPVDDPAIKIVQIRGGEPAAFQRNERTQIGRDHRENVEHHPVGPGVRVLEALHQLDALGQFLANLFALGVTHGDIELLVELVQIDLGQEFFHRVRAHAGDKILAVLFLGFAIFHFIEQLALLQRRLARIDHDVILVIDDALELPRAHVQH